MDREAFGRRIEALAAGWRAWAQLGGELSDPQWDAPTRCPGWKVVDVYAHHSLFPPALAGEPPGPGPAPAGSPLTAVEVLEGFNRPGGVVSTMSEQVAAAAVADAEAVPRQDLVERFSVTGPAAVERLRGADPAQLVAWPAAGPVTLTEALRIVVMECTVHLLDVLRAVGREPVIPAAAQAECVAVLVEMADPVELIEAATGRPGASPFPVIR